MVVAAKHMAASLISVNKPVSKAHLIGCPVNGGVSRGSRVNGPACWLSPQPPPRCNDVLAVPLGIPVMSRARMCAGTPHGLQLCPVPMK